MLRTVTALYVEPDGPYAGLEGVEVWDEARDARTYAGPHPVVAHPPCARWCQIAPINVFLGRFTLGDDGGMFASALDCVRKFGGVLEHPARTYAWKAYGLLAPPRDGAWVRSLYDDGWVCEVKQGHYGNQANKPTWLYSVGCELPILTWGESDATGKISRLQSGGSYARGEPRPSFRMALRGAAALVTPDQFRDLLLSMARSVPC